MTKIERYLRRATRGTWGRKRADIREELAAHIHERVQIHRIGGLDEDAAVEKALAELGEAGQVSAGMMKLHSMPTLLGSSLLCICALTLFVTTLSGSVAQQVSGSFIYPSSDCVDSENFDCDSEVIGGTFWVTEDALNAALEPQGANVIISGDSRNTSIVLNLPDGEVIAFENLLGTVMDLDKVVRRKADHVSLWDILAGFAKEAPTAELSVSGWEQPSIGLGELKLNISADGALDAKKFYESYLAALLSEKLSSDLLFYDGVAITNYVNSSRQLDLNVASVEEAVYGLITMTSFTHEPFENTTNFDLSVTRPNAAGQLEFPSNSPNTTFLKALPDEPQENVSILVKLAGGTNGDWYEIISPEDITVN